MTELSNKQYAMMAAIRARLKNIGGYGGSIMKLKNFVFWLWIALAGYGFWVFRRWDDTAQYINSEMQKLLETEGGD